MCACVCVRVPEVGSVQPSWDRPCEHARSVSACAAGPSALHGRTSSAGSAPDEPGDGNTTQHNMVSEGLLHTKHM